MELFLKEIEIKFSLPCYGERGDIIKNCQPPCALVKGKVSFFIEYGEDLVDLKGQEYFDLQEFKLQIRKEAIKHVKEIISVATAGFAVSVAEAREEILQIVKLTEGSFAGRVKKYGIKLTELKILKIEVDAA